MNYERRNKSVYSHFLHIPCGYGVCGFYQDIDVMPTINKIVKRKTIDLNVKLKHDSFYDRSLWRNLRGMILNRDNGICKYCEAKGIPKAGNIVDHVLPRRIFPELETDETNLVTCCQQCHNKKRYYESLSKDRLQTKMNLRGAGFVFIKTNSK